MCRTHSLDELLSRSFHRHESRRSHLSDLRVCITSLIVLHRHLPAFVPLPAKALPARTRSFGIGIFLRIIIRTLESQARPVHRRHVHCSRGLCQSCIALQMRHSGRCWCHLGSVHQKKVDQGHDLGLKLYTPDTLVRPVTVPACSMLLTVF
jgi:hypothetical protein